MNKIRVEAGKHDIFVCPVCRSRCTVERDKLRPKITGFASAMAWSSCPARYDEFTCSNANKEWHKQIEQLQKEKRNTASPSIKNLLDEDIASILNDVFNGDIQ